MFTSYGKYLQNYCIVSKRFDVVHRILNISLSLSFSFCLSILGFSVQFVDSFIWFIWMICIIYTTIYIYFTSFYVLLFFYFWIRLLFSLSRLFVRSFIQNSRASSFPYYNMCCVCLCVCVCDMKRGSSQCEKNEIEQNKNQMTP